VAAFLFLIKGKGKNAGSVLRAHLHFLQHLKIHSAKRKALQKEYPSYSRKNIHPGLIIFDYYLRNRKRFRHQ
jgi:hypothetical protein